MGVANVHTGNASNEVDIFPSVLVIEKLLIALDSEEGLLIVMGVGGGYEGFILLDLLVGPACVGLWPCSSEESPASETVYNQV